MRSSSRLVRLLNRVPIGLRAGVAVGAVAVVLASTGTGTAYFTATTRSAVHVSMLEVTPSQLHWAGAAAGGASMVPDVSRWTLAREATNGTTWASVATGGFHTCAITTGGELYCWGANSSGQLGLGNTIDRSTPTKVTSPAAVTWASVTAGRFHTCARTTESALYCWGGNSVGQIGNGTQVNATSPVSITVPLAPTNGSTWTQVSAGEYTTCGVTNTGKGHCWGASDLKQVGKDGAGPFNAPTLMKPPNDFAQVSAGYKHGCGINAADAAYCWGAGHTYALGIALEGPGNVNPPNEKDTPTVVATGGTYKAVSAGRDFTCMITKADSKLQCVGAGYYGQTGTGTLATLEALTQVGSLTTWTAVSAGERSACGLAGTTLYCWGSNGSGEFGLGHADPQYSPVAVPAPGGGTWSAMSLRYNHLCAITSGALYCAGADGYGQLGRGSTGAVPSASLRVIGAKTWTAVAAGGSTTCGVAEDTTLWCWGSNASGQLGNGTTTSSAAPVQVGADIGWSKVTVGGAHACAIKNEDELWCWGRNSNGQLGDNSTTNRSTPVQVTASGGTITAWKTVSAGGLHTCAIPKSNAGVYCFGANGVGQLGDNSTTGRTVPTAVSGGPTNWDTVVAGANFACGTELSAATGVWCWGDNRYSQLGKKTDPLPKIEKAPVNWGGAVAYVSLTAGGSHACAIDPTPGTSYTYCWGAGSRGQNGKDQKNKNAPGDAPKLSFAKVAAGGDTTCAVGGTYGSPNGTVSCWGDNSAGQLGQGSFSDQAPVKTPTSTPVPSGTEDGVSLVLGDRALFLLLVESDEEEGPPVDLTYEEAVLASAPDSYWRLNDDKGTKAVRKKGAFDGTYTGGFTLKQPGALANESTTGVALNGVDGYIDFGDKYDFKGKEKMSAEIWVKRTGPLVTTDWYRLFSKDRYGSSTDRDGWEVHLDLSTGTPPGAVIFGRYQGASATEVKSTGTLAANTWYHVVATYDGTNMRLYVNGVLQGTTASALNLADHTVPFKVGKGPYFDFFPGVVDEVAIYKRALSGAEILAHYEASLP